MGNGFLDDLADMGLMRRRRRQSKRKSADPDTILYIKLRCPRCHSTNVPVYDSHNLPIRYHRCADCGHQFKSVETNYRPEGEKTGP